MWAHPLLLHQVLLPAFHSKVSPLISLLLLTTRSALSWFHALRQTHSPSLPSSFVSPGLWPCTPTQPMGLMSWTYRKEKASGSWASTRMAGSGASPWSLGGSASSPTTMSSPFSGASPHSQAAGVGSPRPGGICGLHCSRTQSSFRAWAQKWP